MKAFLKFIALIGAVTVSVWLGAKILPLTAPFLPALAAAAAMEPAVTALTRRGVRRGAASGILTAIVLFVCGGLAGGCALGGAHMLTTYAKQTPQLLSTLSDTANLIQQKMLIVLRNVPDSVEQELLTAAEGVSAQLSEVPLWLSRKALDGLTLFAKQSPDLLLFGCTAIIGVYFFSLYFRDICGFFRRQLSEEALQKLSLIRAVTLSAVAGYLKVQCILSGVTFLILLAAFHFMGVGGAVSAALGIAVIDALPILGSGAVLIPWAVIAALSGNIPRAAALVLVYCVLLVMHNLLQAKFMGSHLGLHPVTALVSLYVGWKLAGLGGMLLLPIACVLLCSLNHAGVIHLYREIEV
ncbi:MAG: AI-2E family transporter [Oscillospiraceae bacterium]|nr:AI-2E family transporter [Oscillospiraceae bacterium]